MTEEHSHFEHDKADVMSPTVQRRLWRRVWICVAALVLLAPFVLWIAIDQGGKAEWREVQARLKAKGEATDISKILQSNEAIDEKHHSEGNFCYLPVFQDDADEEENQRRREARKALAYFTSYGASGDEADGFPQSPKAPRFHQGSRVDLRAWRIRLDAIAESREEEGRLLVDESRDAKVIAAYLRKSERTWEQLEQALEKPHARIPFTFEKTDSELSIPWGHPNLPVPLSFGLDNLLNSLLLRTICALDASDTEGAAASCRAAHRLVQGLMNHPMKSDAAFWYRENFDADNVAILHCLWSDEFRSDGVSLSQLQRTLDLVDTKQVILAHLQWELAYAISAVFWMEENPEAVERYFQETWHLGSSQDFFEVPPMPAGWFQSNVAFLGDCHWQLISDLGKIAPELRWRELSQRALRIDTEADSLVRLKRWSRGPALAVRKRLSDTIAGAQAYDVTLQQLRIVIAIYRFRLENSAEFPSTLEELCPRYLDSVPFDAYGVSSMLYEKDAEAPGGFRLWSVGPDGENNGGAMQRGSVDSSQLDVFDRLYKGDIPFPVVPQESRFSG